ncbi:MAG TPA: hypothetical protein VFZ53_33965 [Polyangiaceae bacterium]
MSIANVRCSFRGLSSLASFGALVALAVSTVSCARDGQAVARAPSPKATAAAVPAAPPASETSHARRVGDFSVHMISGTFRKQPALLTERVTSEEYGRWVIEYRLEDNDGATTLRVWMNQDSGQVEKVSRVVDGAEKPATVADFDALMASASVVPDTNEGLVANSSGTCTLGPAELDCETKSYKVRIGEHEASLGVTHSDALPGTDLAGQITAADGSVLYRSELIERGNESETANDSFALR